MIRVIVYLFDAHTTSKVNLGMAPPGRRRLRRVVGAAGTSGPTTRGSLTGGASKPYRAGAWLFKTGFFRRGLGWRAVGTDTAEFGGPCQRLVPKPPLQGL